MTLSPARAAAVTARDSYRLAQVANFLSPSSGGLGRVVEAVGRAHLDRGGSRLLVTPAPRSAGRGRRAGSPPGGPGHPVQNLSGDRPQDPDLRVALPGPALPRTRAQYRVLVRRGPVAGALAGFVPHVLQIHDQTTLAWLSGWARRRGVPTVVFAHEQLRTVVAEAVPGVPGRWADAGVGQWLARIARRADAVVCASEFAARPFEDLGAGNVHRVPLGVDLDRFHPQPRRAVELPWREGTVRLVQVARLYPEKHPGLALDTLAVLRARGVPAELVMVGSGPLSGALQARAARMRLPVHLLGHVADRGLVARLTAAADVALCLGSRETFGLSVLEAMAAGTPVVTSDQGAAPELLAPGAGCTARTAREAADAAVRLLRAPDGPLRARRRAEEFSWARATARLRDLELALLDGREGTGSGRLGSG